MTGLSIDRMKTKRNHALKEAAMISTIYPDSSVRVIQNGVWFYAVQDTAPVLPHETILFQFEAGTRIEIK